MEEWAQVVITELTAHPQLSSRRTRWQLPFNPPSWAKPLPPLSSLEVRVIYQRIHYHPAGNKPALLKARSISSSKLSRCGVWEIFVFSLEIFFIWSYHRVEAEKPLLPQELNKNATWRQHSQNLFFYRIATCIIILCNSALTIVIDRHAKSQYQSLIMRKCLQFF